MSLDTFATIVCLISVVICWLGYRYSSENVYLKYKKGAKR